jgi:hypothetical protein
MTVRLKKATISRAADHHLVMAELENEMRLSNITDEHIKGLARFLSLTDDEITEIARGEGWVELYWKNFNSVGSILVNNHEVVFTSDNSSGNGNAGFDEIQYLLDLGYKIFNDDGE